MKKRNRVFENPIIGDKATFLKTSEETDGQYTASFMTPIFNFAAARAYKRGEAQRLIERYC